jgi:FkbM family methyltransferase
MLMRGFGHRWNLAPAPDGVRDAQPRLRFGTVNTEHAAKIATVRRAKRAVRKVLRPLGYDIVQFPNETIQVHLERVLARFRINWALDVGARHGDYARLLRDLSFGGPIVSFEPVRANFEVIARAAADDPDWHVHRLALGSRSSELRMNVSQQSVYSSFLTPSAYALERFPETQVVAEEVVEVRRLDEVFDDVVPTADARVLLKTDTQGWDLEVLRGSTESLRRVHAVQMEMSAKALYDGMPDYIESFSYMKELGFAPSGVFPFLRDEDLRVIEFDCIMLRADNAY